MKRETVAVIYAIINIVNDKFYVGQTFDKHKRWNDHKSYLARGKHGNEHLQSAYDLYGGKKNFIYIVLERFEEYSVDLLTIREDYWMKFYRSAEPLYGYNKAPSAGSPLGFKHKQETKDKLSALRKGKKRPASFGEALSKARTGIPASPEARANMSAAHIGKSFHTDEWKAELSEKMKGNTYAAGQVQTPERIEARAVLHRGVPKSDDHKKKIGDGNRGKVTPPEVRAKQSISAKKRWNTLDKEEVSGFSSVIPSWWG